VPARRDPDPNPSFERSLTMKRKTCLSAVALALLAACATAGYRTDCYEVIAGCLDVDLGGGSWSFAGLCIEKLHDSCPDLKDFEFEAGIDSNGNGRLDPDEKVIDVSEDDPGRSICAGAGGGGLGPEDKGKKILYHYECGKVGQDGPFVSKSGDEEVE
jgi:hypothetical protein